jgi:hypothetical protein
MVKIRVKLFEFWPNKLNFQHFDIDVVELNRKKLHLSTFKNDKFFLKNGKKWEKIDFLKVRKQFFLNRLFGP